MELDSTVGRHDGTVQGVRYFAAAPKTGIFVTEANINKAAENVGTPTPTTPITTTSKVNVSSRNKVLQVLYIYIYV